MILKIPDQEYAVLKNIAELSEDSFSALVKALAETDLKLIQLDFCDDLANRVPALKAPELKSMLRTVSSFVSAIERNSKTTIEFGQDLLETIRESKPKNFPLDKAELLESRLQKIFSAGRIISLTSKAFDVMTEQDRIFCGVRVLSDIRPVFLGPADSISAAVIVHNLRIAYHQDGEHLEFSVAMNQDDLRALIRSLERAEKKDQTLRSFIQNTGVPFFEDKE